MTDVNKLVALFRHHAGHLLEEFAERPPTSCDPDPPAGLVFLVEAKAQTPGCEIRMIFGDREFEIRTFLQPDGRPWPLELTFYLRALNQDDSGVRDSMWIDGEERMLRVLERHRDALRICLPDVLEHPRRVWTLAEAQRQAAISVARVRLREEERDVAVRLAADAFRAADFRRVVDLLEPYSDILSEAQTRKFVLARSRVEAGPV